MPVTHTPGALKTKVYHSNRRGSVVTVPGTLALTTGPIASKPGPSLGAKMEKDTIVKDAQARATSAQTRFKVRGRTLYNDGIVYMMRAAALPLLQCPVQ